MCKHWCILQSKIIRCQIKEKHSEGEHYAEVTFDADAEQTSYKREDGTFCISSLEVEVRW